jgi:hypothetical protein
MTEKALERQIHLGVVQLLNFNAVPGLVWTHVANERRTTPREGAFLKRMGLRAGWADFTLLIPCRSNLHPRTAFLELKRPGGRLSVAQEQFRDDVTAIGCLWALAYSSDQAAGYLKEWGALRKTSSPSTAADPFGLEAA